MTRKGDKTINYSIYSPEDIFCGWSEMELKHKTISLNNNLKVVVEKMGNDNFKIDRIISSEPVNYLRNDISPGNIFSIDELLNIYFDG
ncbi:MAG: YlzJ-like family protein [Halanaerobiaceae bacterium]